MTETIPAKLIVREAEMMMGHSALYLWGAGRSRSLVAMRGAVYLALQKHSHMSLAEIAAYVNPDEPKSHNTVRYGIARCEREFMDLYRELVARVRSRLRQGSIMEAGARATA